MLTVDSLAIARGGRTLLRDLSFSAGPGQRVGVLGPNGCGKSSLFACLVGELEPEAGRLELPEAWTVALARQSTPRGAVTALDFVLGGHEPLAAAFARLREAEASGDGRALAAAHDALAHLDGYSAEARAAELLAGLGFGAEDVGRALDDFSGGWRTRLALARTLFQRPDVLLLDEPTNHLDLPTIDWLAGWLNEFAGLLLCISHDRDFLDRVATHILWIDRPAPRFYTGNLSVAEERRAQVLADEARQRTKNLKAAAHLRSFVDRFRAKASKATQAQSRLKMLERLEITAPIAEYAGYAFSFPDPQRVSTPLLNLDHAALGYGGAPILEDVHLSVLPGDRIGLLGANGAGKSTLMKALGGKLPCAGRQEGRHLAVGYFAQHQLDQLRVDASPLAHLQELERELGEERSPEQKLRDFLGGFGFHGDAAVEPIAPRSGGEKARLALALLAWRRPNLLLLDEPTNHLDLQMRDALALALQDFAGAVVLVSHDRAFLASLSDRLLMVAGGRVRAVSAPAHGEPLPRPPAAERDDDGEAPVPDPRRERRREAARERERLKPLRSKVSSVEREMEAARQELGTVQERLADPAFYDRAAADEVNGLSRRAGELEARIADLEAAWFEAQEALESAAAD